MTDLLGIGYGPSNLALAIAAEEAVQPIELSFIEKQPRFGWHRDMLIDDATMQVSFLKDLVTQRNPSSSYSFVTYLHERGRLADFINHKTLYPLRIEFHDYLEWAAEKVRAKVDYGRRVVDVRPVFDGDDPNGTVVGFEVDSTDELGRQETQRTRDVAVAVGLAPVLPPGVVAGPRVWHNLDILGKVATMPDEPAPRRFVVVGAGQSAAEVVDYLHRRFPTAEICSVFARWGYTPADDTPYANRIFDPSAVDTYFAADDDVKRMLFDYHRNTNYSVVDQELIVELYRREYQEKVQGAQRLRMLNASRVVDVVEADDEVLVEVEFLPDGSHRSLPADAIVYATGYQPTDAVALLGQAGKLVRRRADGTPEVTRDYRLELDRRADAAIYVQGGTEHAHGITATLLSNIAIRTGEIVESIAARSRRHALSRG